VLPVHAARVQPHGQKPPAHAVLPGGDIFGYRLKPDLQQRFPRQEKGRCKQVGLLLLLRVVVAQHEAELVGVERLRRLMADDKVRQLVHDVVGAALRRARGIVHDHAPRAIAQRDRRPCGGVVAEQDAERAFGKPVKFPGVNEPHGEMAGKGQRVKGVAPGHPEPGPVTGRHLLAPALEPPAGHDRLPRGSGKETVGRHDHFAEGRGGGRRQGAVRLQVHAAKRLLRGGPGAQNLSCVKVKPRAEPLEGLDVGKFSGFEPRERGDADADLGRSLPHSPFSPPLPQQASQIFKRYRGHPPSSRKVFNALKNV
jgi:hypothetical protein